MKKILIIILIITNSLSVFSQSINLGFNSTHSGRNITTQYEFKKKNSEYSFGLGFNINKLAHNDNQNNIYKKRLYATKPYHHINVNFTYQYYILTEKVKNIHLFVFYDLQAKYSTTRNEFFYPYGYDSTLVVNNPSQGIIYYQYITNFGPFLWLENNIGIGFTADLSDRFYLKQRLGFGADFILGYGDKLFTRQFKWFDYEFSGHFNVSVGYRFKNSKKETPIE